MDLQKKKKKTKTKKKKLKKKDHDKQTTANIDLEILFIENDKELDYKELDVFYQITLCSNTFLIHIIFPNLSPEKNKWVKDYLMTDNKSISFIRITDIIHQHAKSLNSDKLKMLTVLFESVIIKSSNDEID